MLSGRRVGPLGRVLIPALLTLSASFLIYHRQVFTSSLLAVLPSSLLGHTSMTLPTTVDAGTSARTPVWFVAHGGPTTLYNYEHPAYKHWQTIAREVREAKPKAIVFVSAHWQQEPEQRQGPKSVSINVAETIPLVYDFYGFPKHYYEEKFETTNPEWLSRSVQTQLESEGYEVEREKRGLDHGVWVPLLAAFGPKLDIPLIQISLPASHPRRPDQDGVEALQLGKALRALREQGYAIIGGGQPVHNLREYFKYSQMGPGARPPYAVSFSAALTQALLPPSDAKDESALKDPGRWDAAKALYLRPDYLQAHPTSEHLLPALVALGAAHSDEAAKEAVDYIEGAIAWNMYRFG